MQYNLVSMEGRESLVIDLNDELFAITSTHVRYDQIRGYLINGGDDPNVVREHLDCASRALTHMTRLSERVGYENGHITFDGDRMDNALSRHLSRLIGAGSDQVGSVVAFMENLASNPSAQTRHRLWSWLRARNFTLTSDGHIVGYKAVRTHGHFSIHSGTNTVFVNGEPHTGHVPNPIGAEVSMARYKVDPDYRTACSIGLHVGTWDYAAQLGAGVASRCLLTVIVNPRDVVAVPQHGGDRKMRTCRYIVNAVTQRELTTPVIDDDDDAVDGYLDLVG